LLLAEELTDVGARHFVAVVARFRILLRQNHICEY